MLQFKKETNSQTNILSASGPKNNLNMTNHPLNMEQYLDQKTQEQSKAQEQSKLQTQSQLRTRLKQQLLVYLKDNHYFVEHSAAYALGITNVRAIMMDKPKLIELKPDILNKLKSNKDLEIIYKMIEEEKEKEKQKIQVFVNDTERSISMSAAYSLGLIDDKEFFESDKKDYYIISEDMIKGFNNKFDIEYYPKHLNDEIMSQKKHI